MDARLSPYPVVYTLVPSTHTKSATLLISCSRLFFSSATIKFSFHRLSLESIDGPYLFYSSLPNFRTSKTPKGRGTEKRKVEGKKSLLSVGGRQKHPKAVRCTPSLHCAGGGIQSLQGVHMSNKKQADYPVFYYSFELDSQDKVRSLF
jgi:hypothetical protein